MILLTNEEKIIIYPIIQNLLNSEKVYYDEIFLSVLYEVWAMQSRRQNSESLNI